MVKQNKQIETILQFISRVHAQDFAHEDIVQLVGAMLTPSEIEALSQRIHVLELLHNGRPQRDVSETLGVGVATATRGNRMLKENQGLFEKILK